MELKAKGLTCNRSGREVFRDLSFSLTEGQAMVVTGRNGAGKSSLLRMIAGLVRIAAGQLTLSARRPAFPIG
jgi:heme exporter protein A